MSKETWLQEYYPIAADSPEATASPVAAVKHSIRKWHGLRSSALRHHKIKVVAGGLYGLRAVPSRATPFLRITSTSCALCALYKLNCWRCPLYAVRYRTCDIANEAGPSPYVMFLLSGDPEPMIHWLEAALEFAETKAHVKSKARRMPDSARQRRHCDVSTNP
ncbi:MAG: hypothetical protein ACYDHM_02305 [Acidiferrobacterales bacterium]